MTATNPAASRTDAAYRYGADERTTPRRSTETKASMKTTELMAYIAAVVGVIITALVVGGDNHSADPVSALDAIRYISYLTIGYMLARGLAKSGSREHYSEDGDTRH